MSAAARAERMALAVLNGDVTFDEIREDMQLATRERDAGRQAESLRAYRNGEAVWSWPAVAPWAGF